MKLALLAILFVPLIGACSQQTENRPAPNPDAVQPEAAKVVSMLIVGSATVTTYYNETTEQVCTYAPSGINGAPTVACAPLRELSDNAIRNVKERAAAIR